MSIFHCEVRNCYLSLSPLRDIAKLEYMKGDIMPIYPNEKYLQIVGSLPSFVRRDIYDIPFIEKQAVDISHIGNGHCLINLNNIRSNDKNAQNKIVHAFSYDDVLERYFKHPYKFLDKVHGYRAVASLDFTMTPAMDFKHILSAVYKNMMRNYIDHLPLGYIPTIPYTRK